MKTYELIFQTEPIDGHLQDTIDAHFDAFFSGHGASHFITLSAEGNTASEAAQESAAALSRLGVQVRRLSEDLVSRSDIAERTGVTPQAVGTWIRRERQKAGDPFPEPYNYVSGGIWLWGEVNEWLTSAHGPADELAYPTRDDYTAVNFMLATGLSGWDGARSQARVSWALAKPTGIKPGLRVAVQPTAVRSASSSIKAVISSAPSDLNRGKARTDEHWDSYTLVG